MKGDAPLRQRNYFFPGELLQADDRRRCTFFSAWRRRKIGSRRAMRQSAVILAVVIRWECGQADFDLPSFRRGQASNLSLYEAHLGDDGNTGTRRPQEL